MAGVFCYANFNEDITLLESRVKFVLTFNFLNYCHFVLINIL